MAGHITRPLQQIRSSKSALSGGPVGGYLVNPRLHGGIDAVYGGRCRITGTVDELGVSGIYRVRLFLKDNGMKLRETWSASDGSYKFENIAYLDQGYFLVAHDHSTPKVNAAISDFVTPEPIP